MRETTWGGGGGERDDTDTDYRPCGGDVVRGVNNTETDYRPGGPVMW